MLNFPDYTFGLPIYAMHKSHLNGIPLSAVKRKLVNDLIRTSSHNGTVSASATMTICHTYWPK